MGEESGKGQGRGSSVAATAQATIVAGTREPKKLQAPYTSSLRPHTLVAQGLIQFADTGEAKIEVQKNEGKGVWWR